MPFNGSNGTYTLSDTIGPATLADANELQAILDDIATALTNTFCKDGQSTLSAQVKGFDGTVAAPGYSFSGDSDSGLYRIGANNLGIALAGAKVLDLAATGSSITGSSTTPFAISSTDAGAGIGPILDLYRNSASPATSDIIGAIDFNGVDSGSAKQLYARIYSQITDVTAASEDAILVLQQVIAGSLTSILTSSATTLTSPLIKALTNVTNALSLAGGTTGQRAGSPVAGDIRYNTTLNGLEYYNGTVWIITGQAPTVQTFTSGSAATYTPGTGVTRIRARMAGGGGGGSAFTTNAGSNGAASSFGNWTAAGGNGGPLSGTGTAGGLGGGAATFTVTLASPAVFTATAHGLLANDAVVFSTTGALPTGLTAGTTYYVIAAGLTANAFEVSASVAGAAVNTSGGQSGTHSFAGGDGTGTRVVRLGGGRGWGGAGSTSGSGGNGGGVNAFGGAGAGITSTGAGLNAVANTGAGGGGASGASGAVGEGGGAGEYVEFWVSNPAATTYTVGAAGAGGAAGTNAGGNGAAGIIIIEEFYN